MTTKLTYVEFASANNNPYEKKYYIIKMIVIQIIIMEKVILNFQKVYFKYIDLFSTKGGIFKLYPIIDKLNVSEDQPPNSLHYIDLDSSQVI